MELPKPLNRIIAFGFKSPYYIMSLQNNCDWVKLKSFFNIFHVQSLQRLSKPEKLARQISKQCSNIFLSYTVKIFFEEKSKIIDALMVWLRPVNDKKKQLKAINQNRKNMSFARYCFHPSLHNFFKNKWRVA